MQSVKLNYAHVTEKYFVLWYDLYNLVEVLWTFCGTHTATTFRIKNGPGKQLAGRDGYITSCSLKLSYQKKSLLDTLC
jgi:hypothetical protein